MDIVKAQLKENTEVTCEVRDVLVSFRVIASIAKWVTAIAACLAAMFAAIKGGVEFRQHK
jgi:hypothetical protein